MKVTTNSLRSQQEGMGHVFMVILVLVVLAVIGLIGYKVAGGNKKASTTTTTTTTSTEKTAVDISCVATYHDDNLCHFASHADMDKISYKATLSNTDPNGATSTMTLQSDGKGNTSLMGTGNGEAFNSVQLNGVGYIESDGVWYEYPSGDNAAEDTNPAKNMDLVLGSGITYKPLGKEACGSMTCFKYQVNESVTPDVTQYVWFDTNDYMLRKWSSSDPSSGNVEMTISYASVNITKPSPIKPFSSFGQ